MNNILLEKYLSSEFKFGFELEAIMCNNNHEVVSYPENERKVAKILSSLFGVYVNYENIKTDSSVTPSDDYNDFPFEWASPTFTYNPKTIQKISSGIENLSKNGIYTNSSCGFHTHLSFPNISDKDLIWIISKLSLDEEMFNQLLTMDGIEFYDEEYADSLFIDDIRDLIQDHQWEDLGRMFNTLKYRTLRIHPQGTLEWRGPRNFINVGGSAIKDFFILLNTFIRWISNTIVDNHIEGMSKDNYFKLVFGEEYKENELIKDFNYKVLSDSTNKFLDKIMKSENMKYMNKLLDKVYIENDNVSKVFLNKIYEALRMKTYSERRHFGNKLVQYIIDNNKPYLADFIKQFNYSYIDFHSLDLKYCLKLIEVFVKNGTDNVIIHLLEGLDNAKKHSIFKACINDKNISDEVFCNIFFPYMSKITEYKNFIVRDTLVPQKIISRYLNIYIDNKIEKIKYSPYVFNFGGCEYMIKDINSNIFIHNFMFKYISERIASTDNSEEKQALKDTLSLIG